MATEKIAQLDPNDIYIGENIRYGLKPYRVEHMAEQILSHGGVHTPITVEELKTPIDGKKYRLVFGNYRTAAVSKLNDEQKAGLTIPARVVSEQSEQDRLKLQASENNDRENMSPMDKAIAIQKMISAGLSKMDVRKAFAAAGGRKGNKIKEMSNSYVNMYLSFLDFPKAIQNKIHDGLLPINAAYELYKAPKEKWEPILERAEAQYNKEQDRDEKDEETYLTQNRKADEAEQEQAKASTEHDTVKQEHEAAAAVVQAKQDEVLKATQEYVVTKGEDRKKAAEHKKAAEAELKSAESVLSEKAKALKKAEESLSKLSDKAAAAKQRLEDARNKKAAKAATKVTGSDVKKATKAETGGKAGKLNAQEIADAVKELAYNGNSYTKNAGTLLQQCFAGEITPTQCRTAFDKLFNAVKTGVPPTPAGPAKKK